MTATPVVPMEIEAPEDEATRYIRAIIDGEIADAVFAMRCEVAGVTPEQIGWDVELLVLAGATGSMQ